jgi:O-antigen/teichoic acid export membrane protein
MSRRRDAGGLVVGSAVNGLLAYVVFAVTTRALGPTEAAPVSVLWSYWAFAGAAVTFPLQHWVTRTVAAHGRRQVRLVLPALAGTVLALSLLAGAVAWLADEQLFNRAGAAFPMMVGLVTLGAAATGLVRGELAAAGRFRALAASLVAENAVRCVAVGALAIADVDDAAWFGLGLVVGHLVVLAWPDAFRMSRQASARDLAGPARFLFGAGLSQMVHQTLLTGGPVVLAVTGGSPAEVTVLFAALALFRAPFILALGLTGQLSAHVAHLAVGGRTSRIEWFTRLAALSGVVGGVLGALVGAAVGPALLRWVFGAEVQLDRGQAAIIAAGCSVAVATLALSVVALGRNRAGGVAQVWLAATAAAVVAYAVMAALTDVPPSPRITWCFLVAEVVALAGLWLRARGRVSPTA